MNEKIIMDNIGLVHKVIKDLHCNCSNQDEYQDYYEIGLLGLVKASKVYNEELSKSKFLYLCIKHELTKYFKYKTYQKRYNGMKTISLNEPYQFKELYLEDLITSDEDIEKNYIQQEQIKEIMSALKNIKNKENVILFKKYFGIGYRQRNLRELSKEYGVTSQCIYERIKHTREKIRKEIENV